MGSTITEKIIAAHCRLDKTHAGQIVNARPDIVYANDITGALMAKELKRLGGRIKFDRQNIFLMPIHFGPAKDIQSAAQIFELRQFASEQNIPHYYDAGRMGIDNVFLPEQGFVAPGDLIIGGDSHASGPGAVGALSIGMGSTDLAAILATGETWLRVPASIYVELGGKLGQYVTSKDAILQLIGQIGVAGALYKAIEFGGKGIHTMVMDDRMTLCNMAVEAGAKNAIIAPDETTHAYVSERVKRPYQAYASDPDAAYEQHLFMDLNDLVPVVAKPFSPGNVVQARELSHIRVDQVVIGSCTNGKLSDLRQAASIMSNRKVAAGVRVLVFPATRQIYLEALREGLLEILIEAGCAVSTPTCGPCAGFQMGVLDANEVCVSTTPRNFRGRMGHSDSQVYLAGPYVAAASAVTGFITDPREVM